MVPCEEYKFFHMGDCRLIHIELMRAQIKKERCAGFSLVEVCLAIAVVGIGLLGVFSLFPAGLTMNKKNTDATVSTMFAEDVFNAFHAVIDSYPAKWIPPVSEWKNDPDLEFGPTALDMWNSKTRDNVFLDISGSVSTNVYENLEDIADIALRYKINFYETEDDLVRHARLVVWNGEFGSSDEKDAYIYVTTFYNYGL